MLAMIDPGTEQKLEKLLKLLTSDKDGEVVAAARAIKRTLNSAGTDIHELAERVKGGGGLSKAEMQKIYDAGVRDGKDAAAADGKFADVEGPSYLEMAEFCVEHDNGRLTAKERDFVDDMTRWCIRREPTEKQARWLHLIWVRLGKRR
jgi:hypothetical protein